MTQIPQNINKLMTFSEYNALHYSPLAVQNTSYNIKNKEPSKDIYTPKNKPKKLNIALFTGISAAALIALFALIKGSGKGKDKVVQNIVAVKGEKIPGLKSKDGLLCKDDKPFSGILKVENKNGTIIENSYHNGLIEEVRHNGRLFSKHEYFPSDNGGKSTTFFGKDGKPINGATETVSGGHTIKKTYKNGKLEAVETDGKKRSKFEYDDKGRTSLVTVSDEDGLALQISKNYSTGYMAVYDYRDLRHPGGVKHSFFRKIKGSTLDITKIPKGSKAWKQLVEEA